MYFSDLDPCWWLNSGHRDHYFQRIYFDTMSKGLTLKTSITIHADAATVWRALTDPQQIREYMFGTETVSDWKTGSPIVFKGEWEGKAYEDKGTILDIRPNEYLKYNYWSPMSTEPDAPENYANITYELEKQGDGIVLSISQDGIKDEEAKKRSEGNWHMMLEHIKKMIESK